MAAHANSRIVGEDANGPAPCELPRAKSGRIKRVLLRSFGFLSIRCRALGEHRGFIYPVAVGDGDVV